MRFDPEPEAILVSEGAEDPGRIVDKTAVMQDAYESAADVALAAERVMNTALIGAAERNRDRIDRKVAATQVLVEPPEPDMGEKPWGRIRLGPGPGQVDLFLPAIE